MIWVRKDKEGRKEGKDKYMSQAAELKFKMFKFKEPYFINTKFNINIKFNLSN